MSLRLRILLATAILVVVPLMLYAWRAHQEMTAQLTAQNREQLEGVAGLVELELEGVRTELGKRLAALKPRLDDDNRLRLAVLHGTPSEREYLRDYGEGVMALMGLSMLQLQDASGRILTSGHFRNEYDRIDRTAEFLAQAPGGSALLLARGPNEFFLVMARVDSMEIGGRPFRITAGVEVGSGFLFRLAPGRDVTVSLLYPGGARSSDHAIQDSLRARAARGSGDWTDLFPEQRFLVRRIDAPFVATTPNYELTSARFLVGRSLANLEESKRKLAFWLLASLAVIAGGTLLFAVVLSHILSRPIRELAGRTTEFDLDNPDTRFIGEGGGEVETLTRFLGTMTDRLRASAEQLREAERRATLGEVARQVNHDIRNGLTPIRNVIRHLSQVADEEPGRLGTVFAERRHTLETSVSYLEQLAVNYARLSPAGQATRCDLNRIARQAAGLLGSGLRAAVTTELGSVPPVEADPIAIRRILENLIRNGIESREGGARVAIATRTVETDGGMPSVELTVADDGPGMSEDRLERIFDDFYTTKEGGAGLGLSIVRRLVADAGGTIRVESTPSLGTTFVLRFPATSARTDSVALDAAETGGEPE